MLLIAFMFFVFIEIIELNICNLSFNTQKNIGLRASSEFLIGIDNNKELNKEIKVGEELELDSSFSSNKDNNL